MRFYTNLKVLCACCFRMGVEQLTRARPVELLHWQNAFGRVSYFGSSPMVLVAVLVAVCLFSLPWGGSHGCQGACKASEGGTYMLTGGEMQNPSWWMDPWQAMSFREGPYRLKALNCPDGTPAGTPPTCSASAPAAAAAAFSQLLCAGGMDSKVFMKASSCTHTLISRAMSVILYQSLQGEKLPIMGSCRSIS